MDKYYLMALIATLCLMLIVTYCIYKNVKIIYKLIACIKTPVQKIIYCFLMFLSSFSYVFVSLTLNEIISEFSSILSAFFLLLSIWVVNMIFEKLFPENKLEMSDKHWAIILSYISVSISGGIISMQYGSKEYLVVSSIAISVLIGSYISIGIFLESKSLIILLKEYVDSIKVTSKNIKLILGSSVCFGIFLFLCFSPYNDITNQIIYGIGMGEAIFFVGFFICIYRIEKRKKQKKN